MVDPVCVHIVYPLWQSCFIIVCQTPPWAQLQILFQIWCADTPEIDWIKYKMKIQNSKKIHIFCQSVSLQDDRRNQLSV